MTQIVNRKKCLKKVVHSMESQVHVELATLQPRQEFLLSSWIADTAEERECKDVRQDIMTHGKEVDKNRRNRRLTALNIFGV